MTIAKSLMILGSLSLIASQAFATDAPNGASDGKHGQFFEKLDTNKDGALSLDEFQKGSEMRFKKLDANGDGKATKEEMKAHHDEMKARHGKTVAPEAGQ